MEKLVYVVDDEQDILELVKLNMEKSGFKTSGFLKASELFHALDRRLPDVIILDLMLPDMDGIEICKKVRAEKKCAHLPIIMLTAKGDETDRILGLELGADDYVTKPFSPKELVARVKALLRRQHAAKDEPKVKQVGDILSIDWERYEVKVKGKLVELTQTEFKILRILLSNIGRVYSREEILDQLWGHDKIVIDRTVDVHIKHLREKLGKSGAMIKNVRGVGYKFEQ